MNLKKKNKGLKAGSVWTTLQCDINNQINNKNKLTNMLRQAKKEYYNGILQEIKTISRVNGIFQIV